jgi:hypothetical protein
MPPESESQDELMGAMIAGRYRIISRLGAGGMGVAYRAWDEQGGVPVVIKIPKRIFLADSKFVERFHREIRLLQGLKHPHIVPIVDVGDHEGLPFVVMRFLPGGSLSNRRLRDDQGKPRPNPPAMLHLWLPAVAEALDYVHSQGVVHRDVKPGNIFFDAFWGAYLGDFGIAKIVEESDTFDKEQTLTATHVGIGTQEYMAPEQFTPKAVIDGRADQYALAVMVYEMLAGGRPFTGSTAHIVVEVTTYPVPPLPVRRSDVSPALIQAVHKALSKQPAERFATCGDFAAAVLRDVPMMRDEPGVARLLCPGGNCNNLLVLRAEHAGKKGKCPGCQRHMKVAANLGALWLLDEARRQRGSVHGDVDNVGQIQSQAESADGAEESTDDFEVLQSGRFPGHLPPRMLLSGWLQQYRLIARLITREQMRRATEVACAVVVAMLYGFLLERKRFEVKEYRPIIAITSCAPEVFEEFEEFEEELPVEQPDTPEQQEFTEAVVTDAAVVENVEVVTDASEVDAASVAVEFTAFISHIAASKDLLGSVGSDSGKAGGISARADPNARKKLVQSGGGSAESEAAVEAALKWFINHQMPDGSWSFDLTKSPTCQGQCKHADAKGAKQYPLAGPTALAILPFLGRGYTHKEGPYKKQMEFAFNALTTKVVKGKGNVGEGSYVQGLAGICLSEAYAMTQDERLQMPAQLAINYIMASQDPAGGSWGYSYRSPGDTSILGWNLMSLKSGQMAFLSVDPLSVKRAVAFLDSVQTDEGSGYGYNAPGNTPALTAAGLLCRMYLGWKKDHPALNRGLDRLAKMGPDNNLYYDYYGTQVMHHVEGDRWVVWNSKMRDMLVKAQAKQGHEQGSWYEGFEGGHGPELVGRLYTTSLATMILEVYYRHLPIYGQQGVDQGFKE